MPFKNYRKIIDEWKEARADTFKHLASTMQSFLDRSDYFRNKELQLPEGELEEFLTKFATETIRSSELMMLREVLVEIEDMEGEVVTERSIGKMLGKLLMRRRTTQTEDVIRQEVEKSLKSLKSEKAENPN